MDDESLSLIGSRLGYGAERPFGFRQKDRLRHFFALGQTGTGKTTLLRNLIVQDIEAGRGVALIDPHGDLADELLDYIPRRRTRDLVYFNPADLERPVGFNPLFGVPVDRRPFVAESIVLLFKQVWGLDDASAPRMLWILYNCLRALLDCPPPGEILLGVRRLLLEPAYRDRVLRYVSDSEVRAFWEEEFARYDPRFGTEAVTPILNKIGRFLAVPAIRNILGQFRPTIDLRFMMDNQRILIANLARGRLGEDSSNLLGGLLLNGLQLAALSRADMKEEARVPFYLFVDEAGGFTTTSFASILSEARKYGLSLGLCCQYLAQVSEEVSPAIFGNVGSLITFRIGAEDAAVLERELAPYPARTLVELSRFEVCARLLSGGEVLEPFVGRTAAPLGTHHGRGEKLVAASRARFTRPRRVVEDKIERWQGVR